MRKRRGSNRADSKSSKQLNKKSKTKPRAEKKYTHAQMKKKVDEWCSKFVRWSAADEDGYAKCYTCGKEDHVSKLQAGHFASRRHMNTRWDHEWNIRVQCISCNLYSQGEQWVFGQALDKERPGVSAEVMRRSKQLKKFGMPELRKMYEWYKEKCEEIAKVKKVRIKKN